MNYKAVLRWIAVSLILVAPFFELTKVILDNYHLFPSFDPLNFGASRKLDSPSLYQILYMLKYFFLLYALGCVVLCKYYDLYAHPEIVFISLVYSMVFLFASSILLSLTIEGLVYLYQLNPFAFISCILISLSLFLSKNLLANKQQSKFVQ